MENYFHFSTVSEKEIEHLPNGLTTSKAPGMDSLPARFLKDVTEVIACPLFHQGKKTWMTANYLKVNDDKSEFMPVVPRSAAHLLEGLTISIGEVRVSAVKKCKDFGCLSGLSFGHVP